MLLDLDAARAYLEKDVPRLLDELQPDTQALWGAMTAHHMVEHLIVTLKLARGRVKIPIVTPPEKWERSKPFIIGDREMPKSVPSPVGKDDLQPLRTATIEDAIQKAKTETDSFLRFLDETPEHMANHPYGGPLNADEWLLAQYKHFNHHFRQFGLTDEVV